MGLVKEDNKQKLVAMPECLSFLCPKGSSRHFQPRDYRDYRDYEIKENRKRNKRRPKRKRKVYGQKIHITSIKE